MPACRSCSAARARARLTRRWWRGSIAFAARSWSAIPPGLATPRCCSNGCSRNRRPSALAAWRCFPRSARPNSPRWRCPTRPTTTPTTSCSYGCWRTTARGARRSAMPCPPGEAHERVRLLMDVRLYDYDADAERLLRAYEALLERYPRDALAVAATGRPAGRDGARGRSTGDARAARAPARVRDRRSRCAWPSCGATTSDAPRENARLLERVLRARPADAAALTPSRGSLWASGRPRAGARAAPPRRVQRRPRRAARAGLRERRTPARPQRRGARPSCARGWRGSASAPALPPAACSRCSRSSAALGEAFAVLHEALARHPDGGELLLFAPDAEARHGRLETGRRLLEASRGRAKEADRLRVQARLCRWSGDPAASLEAWRAVAAPSRWPSTRCQPRPSWPARSRGPTPRSPSWSRLPLARRPVRPSGTCSSSGCARTRRAARRHSTPCSASTRRDVWAHRERALLLSRAGRHDEALAALAPALSWRPPIPARSACTATCCWPPDAVPRRASASAPRCCAVSTTCPASTACSMPPTAWMRDATLCASWQFSSRRSRRATPVSRSSNAPAACCPPPRRWPCSSGRGGRSPTPGRHGPRRPTRGSTRSSSRRHERSSPRRPPASRSVAALWIDTARVHRFAGDAAGEIAALRAALVAAPSSGLAAAAAGARRGRGRPVGRSARAAAAREQPRPRRRRDARAARRTAAPRGGRQRCGSDRSSAR